MDKTIISLTDNCRFHLGDVPDAWQAWFDDDDWEEVTLPHDWSVTLPFSTEYSSGTGYLAGGIGWYRIRVSPHREWQGKQISLVFDGVYKNSKVWCNSYYLGYRPNGYISFSYDITEQFRFDRDTVIVVCVDHRDIADSRWFTGSGIIRKLSLVIEEAFHPVYNGIFFSASAITQKFAEVSVDCELINTSLDAVCADITSILRDLNGNIVGQSVTKTHCEAGKTVLVKNAFEVLSPLLWSPEQPNLYVLETVILDGDVTYLADSQRVGIREMVFDPDKGFFVNGKSLLIKGVCVHDDAGCLGAAVYPSVWRRRLLKLQSMGCNAIRMSHNPHMPELYDLCDELGFLVMDEAFDEWEGPKNKWWRGHNVYPPKNQGYYIDFPQWHRQDLSDLVRRDRNHPSVILWSIGNEIDYPNDPYCHPSFEAMTGNNDADKPISERKYNPYRPNMQRIVPIAVRLRDIVRENDTTRPVTLAAAFPELSAKIGFLDSMDVIGYNYKEELYEQSRAKFPNKPILGSENSHSLAAWKAVTDTPCISGQFLWTGIDYLGEAKGWPVHGSMAGLLTLAGFEKPEYFRRQSLWSNVPMIHLTSIAAECAKGEFVPVSERWDYPEGSKVLVKCYTNLSRVEFFLNHREIGIWEKAADSDCISFEVPFEAGELKACSVLPDEPLTDSIFTTGCACQVIISVTKNEEENGYVLYQAELTMADADGKRVYGDSTLLHVSVEGGRLIGIENGDLADVTPYRASYRRAYRGQLLIYIIGNARENAPIVYVKSEVCSAKVEL